MLSLAKFIKKEIQLRENLVGTGFLEPPPRGSDLPNRVTCMGEIVDAQGFDAPKTYIFFETFLPDGWSFEDYNKYETMSVTREDNAEFNKRNSSTHISNASVEPTDYDEETIFVSNFCFPFDYQFVVSDKGMETRPYLLVQVNSVDSWGRHRIEGYGFARFPAEPGYHQVTIETWKPRGSLSSQVHSFFLGGGIRVLKIEELIRTRYLNEKGESDIVNRFGLETEDSGRVTVNFNICEQSYL